MLEKLKQLDTSLLLFFNHLNNPVLDTVMYWVSNRFVWIPLYLCLLFFIFKNYRQQFVLILLLVAVAVTLSDQLASSVIKNAVMRLRPCHNPAISGQVHLVYGYCGGQYGFVSSHAANAFSLFTFLSLMFRKNFRKITWILAAWAMLISFSRIYLGAHYPGDVAGGALLGVCIGFISEKILHYLAGRFNKKIS